MDKQQNIDDILKLLKNSYGENDSETETVENIQPQNVDTTDDISHDELHKKLKEQFISDSVPTAESDESGEDSGDSFEYNIDGEFLEIRESYESSEIDEEYAEETVAESVDEEIIEEEIIEEEIIEEEIIEEAENEDTGLADDGEPPFDMEDAIGEVLEAESAVDEAEDFEDIDSDEDGIFVEDKNGEIVFQSSEEYRETDGDKDIDEFDALIEDTIVDEIEIEDNVSEDVSSDTQAEETVFFSGEDGQLAMFEDSAENYFDEVADETEEDSDDLIADEQIAIDFGGLDDIVNEDDENDDGKLDEIDDSILALMYEFGDVSTINSSVGSERIATYLNKTKEKETNQINPAEAFGFDGDEYERAEQTEEVFDAYRRDKLFTLLRVLGCAFFVILLTVYELVATFGNPSGIFSYDEYPTAYMLLDIQLIICAAAFAWRELLAGFKRAFTFKVGRWSAVSLVCVAAVIYNFAMVAVGFENTIYLFGSVTSAYILFGLVSEYLEVCREIKSFGIYASDKKKFTFDTERLPGSSADKMYQGGVSKSKKIFEPREIDFPSGYFSAVNSAERVDWSLNYSIIPIIILSALAFLVNILLGESPDMALAMFMITFTVLAPISAFATHIFPMFRMSSRLYKREAAIAGEEMAHKYAKCDYIVFKDMHLFKAASAHDNGIVVYDERNAKRTIEYLGALYSVVGGPMKDVFGNAEDKHTVRLRRVARNGVEAVLDNAHSLILGDAAFMGRYGVNFSGRDSVGTGQGIILFAIDTRPAAKLCLKYKTEPVFEMLISKLAAEGVKCAIETYDPAINGAFVAECRESRKDPVNVIHKNVADYYREPNLKADENTGLVVCSSRLKLVECIVWCKRILQVWKISSVLQIILSCLITIGIATVIAFGEVKYLTQYGVFLAQIICMLPTFAVMRAKLPSEDYFTTETVYRHTSHGQIKKDKKEAENINE